MLLRIVLSILLVPWLLSIQTPKVAVPAKRPQAELTLTVDRPSVRQDEDPGFHVTIRNVGREPLRLIHPQDGSEAGWRNPSIAWVLPDRKSRGPIGRCGNTNPILESAFFTLAPGRSVEISPGWAGRVQLSPGTNRVSFAYDIAPERKDEGFSGFAPDSLPPGEKARQTRVDVLYARLTPIRLMSNVVRVTLRAEP